MQQKMTLNCHVLFQNSTQLIMMCSKNHTKLIILCYQKSLLSDHVEFQKSHIIDHVVFQKYIWLCCVSKTQLTMSSKNHWTNHVVFQKSFNSLCCVLNTVDHYVEFQKSHLVDHVVGQKNTLDTVDLLEIVWCYISLFKDSTGTHLTIELSWNSIYSAITSVAVRSRLNNMLECIMICFAAFSVPWTWCSFNVYTNFFWQIDYAIEQNLLHKKSGNIFKYNHFILDNHYNCQKNSFLELFSLN